MLEARLAQRAGRELRVEGHRADDLVDGDVLVPGLAREETGSAHGDGVPETDRRAPRRVQNMVGPGDIALAVTSMACVSNITHGRLNCKGFSGQCQKGVPVVSLTALRQGPGTATRPDPTLPNHVEDQRASRP